MRKEQKKITANAEEKDVTKKSPESMELQTWDGNRWKREMSYEEGKLGQRVREIVNSGAGSEGKNAEEKWIIKEKRNRLVVIEESKEGQEKKK